MTDNNSTVRQGREGNGAELYIMEGLQVLIPVLGIVIYYFLPVNILALLPIDLCMQVGRGKIALVLSVGEEFLFIFVGGLQEEREIVLFLFVLCLTSTWPSPSVYARSL